MSATPLSSPTLESVQQAFDQWRATRGKRMRTPIDLQSRAVALRKNYCAAHICSALRINDTALKRWASDLAIQSPMSVASPGFVELPQQPVFSSANVPDNTEEPAHCISIDLGDAIQLRVHAHFTLEQILCAARQHTQAVEA